MPTLLHISDLHRTSGPRLRNDELFTAILSDSPRWKLDGIPDPDLIIVSGDLIQGVNPEDFDAASADDEISRQYEEASDLLGRLADEFLNCDRARLIMVPGNHDVDWPRSLASMRPTKDYPRDIGRRSRQPSSLYRWSWKNCQAYTIADSNLYATRLDHFNTFRARFYENIDDSCGLKVNDDFLFSEYPDIGLAVGGFSSWYGNDCFCHVGDISPSALAESQSLIAKSTMPVAVAVWHHGIVGGPRHHDYMDQRVVHRLIDFGFNVGLHGHQHYPPVA